MLPSASKSIVGLFRLRCFLLYQKTPRTTMRIPRITASITKPMVDALGPDELPAAPERVVVAVPCEAVGELSVGVGVEECPVRSGGIFVGVTPFVAGKGAAGAVGEAEGALPSSVPATRSQVSVPGLVVKGLVVVLKPLLSARVIVMKIPGPISIGSQSILVSSITTAVSRSSPFTNQASV